MITLFFGPEGHVSYSLTFLHVWEYNKAGLDSVSAPSPWSSVGPLILAFLWILVSRFSFSHHTALSPVCWAGLDRVWLPVVRFWFGLVWLLYRYQVQIARDKMEALPVRFHATPRTSLGKNLNDWSTYSYDRMTKKNHLKLSDLYCHRMGKWTKVPLCPGLFSYSQQSRAAQTKTSTYP